MNEKNFIRGQNATYFFIGRIHSYIYRMNILQPLKKLPLKNQKRNEIQEVTIYIFIQLN